MKMSVVLNTPLLMINVPMRKFLLKFWEDSQEPLDSRWILILQIVGIESTSQKRGHCLCFLFMINFIYKRPVFQVIRFF